jgi:hypothetical protein
MDAEGRWLTYGELATIRGTKRASAIKLAQRERWPRQAGNDRSQTVRVLVPGEWLVSARDRPVEAQDAGASSHRGMPGGFAKALEAANRRADEANQRADVAMALADRTLGQLAEATERIEQADARADRFERNLAAALSVADMARAAARQAEQQAEALRQAEAARKARGHLRRVWEAWRGV